MSADPYCGQCGCTGDALAVPATVVFYAGVSGLIASAVCYKVADKIGGQK